MYNSNQNISLKEVQEKIKRIWEESLGTATTIPPQLNNFQRLKIAWNKYHNNNEHNKECNCINIDNETIKKMAREVSLTTDVLRNGFRLLDNIESFPDIGRKFNNAEKGRSKISITKLLKEKLREQQRNEIIAKSKDYVDTPEVTIVEGDFREQCNFIESDSIDFLLLDPPYGREYLCLLEDIAKQAERVLKEGSYLAIYHGTPNLNKVVESLGKYLNYCDTIALVHSGNSSRIWNSDVIAGWKPIIIFSKGQPKRLPLFKNLINGLRDSKIYHEWGQSVEEARHLIRLFTNPGESVADFMAGGGTVPLAAAMEKRRCMCFEIDPVQVQIIKGRMAETKNSNQIDKNDALIAN